MYVCIHIVLCVCMYVYVYMYMCVAVRLRGWLVRQQLTLAHLPTLPIVLLLCVYYLLLYLLV
jgi:hypothetical protein